MAIIEFINSKNKHKEGLKKLMKYVQLPSKTREELVTTIGCSPKTAYEEFVFTKNYFNKDSGRQYIHFTQAFSPGDPITPEQAHEIGKKLLEKHKQFEGFQIVMTTHTDKDHLHNHFVINTVRNTGKKWQQSNYDLAQMKDLSDEIAAEYGAYIIDHRKEGYGYVANGEFKSIKEERSWKQELQNAIWEARRASVSKEEFIGNMEKLGYKVDWEYEKESSEILHFQAILNVCKYNADDADEFKQNLQFYDIDLTWKVVAVINGEDYEFETKEEMKKYIDSLVVGEEESLEVQWTDKIEFERDGIIYTPEHFEKMRFAGNSLRDAFELNRSNEKTMRKLPNEEDIKIPKTNDNLRKLAAAVKACKACSQSEEEFIKNMENLGYKVDWNPKHKYIVFHVEGQKFRNRMLRPNKSFTKESLTETFAFNKTMKTLIDENKIKTYEQLVKIAGSKKGKTMNLSVNKKGKVELTMHFKEKDKKCFFFEKNIEQMIEGDGTIKIASEDEIYESIRSQKIMFTTPDGKKCTNQKFYPSDKYTKEGFEESFKFNAERIDMLKERERFNMLLSILSMMKSDTSDNNNNKKLPLSKLQSAASIKEYILQMQKGQGMDFER